MNKKIFNKALIVFREKCQHKYFMPIAKLGLSFLSFLLFFYFLYLNAEIRKNLFLVSDDISSFSQQKKELSAYHPVKVPMSKSNASTSLSLVLDNFSDISSLKVNNISPSEKEVTVSTIPFKKLMSMINDIQSISGWFVVSAMINKKSDSNVSADVHIRLQD